MTDPWTWTVDQVVHNLCHSDDLWADRQNSRRPNAALLEQKLQEHGIDGATLIEHVDMNVLRGDLGIKAFGEASSIRYAIEKLRNLSPRYVEQQAQTLFRQDSVSKTASEFRRPESSFFKSPFSTAVSTIAFSPKRHLSPIPIAVLEQPAASGHETIEASTIDQITEPPRKRRRVQLITLPATESREARDSFLGTKFVLDDLFFDRSKNVLGDDSDDSEEDDITITRDSQASSAGRNLFVNNRMKHYLRTAPRALAPAKAILQPYPARLLTSQIPHAMLFSVEKGKARMSICNPANPNQQTDTEHAHDPNNEWSFLSKWENKDSEILPNYGDSGSENGYDGSLLSEFEEEEVEREAAKSNQQLSSAEVTTMVNAYIEEQERIWTEEKLPRWQGKAWSIWKKSRGRRRRAQAVAIVKHEIDRMLNRLQKLKQCILEEVWSRSKPSLLQDQCRSLEVTIEEHMQLKFQLEVLQRAQAPERPDMQAVPRVRDKFDRHHDIDDEESLHSESTENFIEHDQARNSPPSSPATRQFLPRPGSEHEATAASTSSSTIKFVAGDIVDLTGSSPVAERSPSSRTRDSSTPDSSPPFRKVALRARRQSLSDSESSSPLKATLVDWDAHPEVATQDEIRGWSYVELEDLSDRKRLILKLRQNADVEMRKEVDLRFDQLDEGKMHNEVKRAIVALKKDEQTIKGVKADASRIILCIARLWICWHKCDHRYMTGAASREVLGTAAEFENFEAFYDFCHSLVPRAVIKDEPDASVSVPRKGVKRFSGGSVRDKGAQRLQKAGQARLLAAEQAKSQLESSGYLESAEQVIINPSKTDDQDYIFVNKHIASRIKPHQVEGIQFIWRELVNTKEMQGCLLAHTMGVSTKSFPAQRICD